MMPTDSVGPRIDYDLRRSASNFLIDGEGRVALGLGQWTTG